MSAADPRRLGEIIDKSRIVVSPTPTGADEPPPDSRCHAIGHGDLDNDVDTLTSVLLRILRSQTVDATRQYQAFAPAPAGAKAAVAGTASPATVAGFDDFRVMASGSPEDVPVPGPMGGAPPSSAKARPKAKRGKSLKESAVPEPRTVGYADLLEEDGWEPAEEPRARRTRASSKA
jgi:hypothetical protein